MKAIVALVAFIFLFYFFFIKSSFAVSVTITNYPSIITDEAFTITASVSGATAGTNYLRVDLFKDGSTSYFGETFNNTDWYGGSTYTQYLPITIQTGAIWGGTIQARVGSPTASEYDGSGTYKMRLRRYTSGGGNTATEANNSAVALSINLPTPTPTPTPTSTPTPTPTPTSTPTSTPTRTPSPTPIPIPTKILVGFEEELASESEILGTSSAEPSATLETPNPEVKTLSASENIPQRAFIISSFLAIITGAGIFIKQKWIK